MAWWMIPVGIGMSAGSSFLGRMFSRKPRQPTVIPNLLPTPKVQVPQISHVSSEDQSESLTYAWGGMIDSVAPGLPIPILGGKCRVGLQLINAYLRSTAQQDVAHALFAVCEGEVSEVVYDQDENHIWVTEDLKLLETDGEWEERTGTKTQTITTWFQEIHQVHDVNIEMVEPVRIVCHFDDDNAGDSQFDNQALAPGTTKKFVTTHGNVEDDTVTKKFGAASAKFPGNAGDYISVAYAAGEFSIGYHDFTMDVWLHMDTAATWKWYTICKHHNVSENTYGWAIGLATDASTASTWRIELRDGAGGASSTLWACSTWFTGSNATWYHLAVVRYGPRVRIYWNGADITDYGFQGVSAHITTASGTPDFMIGLAYYCASVSTQDMTNWFGHMDDFRFVNGKALYTHAFTAPTAAISKYWSIPAFRTKGECEAVVLTFSFPSGIYSGSGGTYLGLRAYFRDVVWPAGEWGGMYGNDTSGWSYSHPELRFGGSMQSVLKRQTTWEFLCIRYDNRSGAGLFALGETITGGTSGATGRVCYDYDLGSYTGVLYVGWRKLATDVDVLLFVENEQITGSTSSVTADVDAVPAGTSPVTAGKATYRNKSKYEFQFHRLTFDYPGVSRYSILTTMDEMLYCGLRHPHTALFALRFPFLGTGPRLNQIGPVSVLADRGTQTLPTWPTGTAARDTSVPAWFALDVLTNTRWGRSLPIASINETSWDAWATHTEGAVGSEKRARWNGMLDSRMDVDEAVAMIGRVGRARITKIGGVRYAALEKTGSASHLFTAGNMIVGSYVRKDLRGDQHPHGYKIWYLDEEREYNRKEYLHKGPAYETTLEPLRVVEEFIVGITKQDEAKRLAILSYQLTTFPNSQCVFSAGVDAVSVLPGDIAKVIPDTPYSIGGRIVDASDDRVLIDRDCSDPSGATTKMTPWGNYLQLVYRDSSTDTIYTEDVEVELDINPAPQLYHPLPDMRAYGNGAGAGHDNAHKTYVNYVFEGVPGDVVITVEFFDVDHNDEVEVLINGNFVANAATTANEEWGPAETFTLPDAQVNDSGINYLQFANKYNRDDAENYRWGVRNVSILSHSVRAGTMLKKTTGTFRANVQMAPTATCTDPDNNQNVTTGWSAQHAAVLSSQADGAGGNCLRVLENGTADPFARKTGVGVTKGKQYRLSYEVRAGTGDQYRVHFYHEGASRPVWLIRTATASWVRHDLYFTATASSTGTIILVHVADAASGTYVEFNNVSLTPSPLHDVYAVIHKGLVGHAGAYATEYRILEADRSQELTFKLSCVEYCHDAYFHKDYGATEI